MLDHCWPRSVAEMHLGRYLYDLPTCVSYLLIYFYVLIKVYHILSKCEGEGIDLKLLCTFTLSSSSLSHGLSFSKEDD